MKNKRMEFIRYVYSLPNIEIDYGHVLFGHQFTFLLNKRILIHLYNGKKGKMSPNWYKKRLKQLGMRVIQLDTSKPDIFSKFETKFIQTLHEINNYRV